MLTLTAIVAAMGLAWGLAKAWNWTAAVIARRSRPRLAEAAAR